MYLVVLRSRTPIGADVNVGHGIVRQAMASDVFAGLIKLLNKLAQEIRTRIVGVLGDPANLAVRPIECDALVCDEVSRRILIIDFLLQFAIRADGALLRHQAGGVVIELKLSATSGILHHRFLRER